MFKHIPIVGGILEHLPIIGQLFSGSQENQQDVENDIDSAIIAGQQVYATLKYAYQFILSGFNYMHRTHKMLCKLITLLRKQLSDEEEPLG